MKSKKIFTIYFPEKIFYPVLLISMFLFLVINFLAVKDEEKPVMSYALANQIVVIDAGHGGIDPGASSKDDLEEKDITLEIAKKLEKHFSQAGSLVIMLRVSDTDLAGDEFTGSIRERKREDLKNRVRYANEAGAHLYLSIHTNADVSPRWSGSQCFYNPKSDASKKLAESIQAELSKVSTKGRDAKPGNYYILEHSEMTAVIIETGFITNTEEARLLNTDEYQEKIAWAIFSGSAKSFLEDVREKGGSGSTP